MKKYVIGVDIGGATVKIGLFTVSGDILEKWEVTTDKEEDGRHILPDTAASILNMLEKKGVGVDEIEGAGVGVPGAVLRESVVNKCVNLGWGVKDVASEFSELLHGIRVKAGNDANVAALGEMWKGGARGFRNVVMVTLGTGIGSGIIINDRILSGSFGAAGEIGHFCMNPEEGEACGCGKKGHLEQYASATGITRLAHKYLAEHPDARTLLRTIQEPEGKDIFDAAKAGDRVALELVDILGNMLGRAFAMISCVIDPDVYVIGGGVSKAGGILIDTIRTHYVRYAFHASERTEIRLAELGNDAGIIGAVRYVL